MGIALAALLAIFAGAHVAIAVGLTRRNRQLRRALLGLVVPPLAPWWAWQAGLRAHTIVWGAALALYTLGVAVTGR
jgi:uncharacterized membrane protein YdcZ (DUF606 family)